MKEQEKDLAFLQQSFLDFFSFFYKQMKQIDTIGRTYAIDFHKKEHLPLRQSTESYLIAKC